MTASGDRTVAGVTAAVLVAGNLAAVAALLVLAAWPHRLAGMPEVPVFLWALAACAAAFVALRTLLGDGWPTPVSRRLVRGLLAGWLFVPAAYLAVRPVPGWDFSDCGTLLRRTPPARHPAANADLVNFVAECDHAYAFRWMSVAVALALAGAVLTGYRWWSHRPARAADV